MQRHRSQRFLIAIALVLLGCGGDNPTCKVGSGSDELVAYVGPDLDYIELAMWSTAEPRNACSGVMVKAHQPTIDGSGTFPYAGGGSMTMCIPRSDLDGTGPLELGGSGSTVQITELAVFTTECHYALAASATGTVSGTGPCSDGSGDAVHELAIDATLPLIATCGLGSAVSTAYASLAGTAHVH